MLDGYILMAVRQQRGATDVLRPVEAFGAPGRKVLLYQAYLDRETLEGALELPRVFQQGVDPFSLPDLLQVLGLYRMSLFGLQKTAYSALQSSWQVAVTRTQETLLRLCRRLGMEHCIFETLKVEGTEMIELRRRGKVEERPSWRPQEVEGKSVACLLEGGSYNVLKLLIQYVGDLESSAC